MSENHSGGLLEKIIPVILILTVGLAFMVGVLWQKVSTLEGGGIKVAGTTATNGSGSTPAPVANGKLADDQAKKVPGVTDRDHIRGNKDAKVTIIEYSDFECPYCKQFHPELTRILDEYKDQVALVYRHFPLSFHQNAQKEAEASECIAEQGGSEAFWKFADLVFERTTSNGLGFDLAKLGPLAKEIGLDESKFQTCLDSDKYKDYVTNQETEGGNAGVNGTPGSFIVNKNGQVWSVPGAVPYEMLKTSVEEALKG